MKIETFSKALVVGTILLFIGANSLSNITGKNDYAEILSLSYEQQYECEPSWDGSVGNPGTNFRVSVMEVFDDGTGPALYTGGFLSAGGPPWISYVGKWDGNDWSLLSGGLGGIYPNTNIRAMAVFNDGSGDALYVGGHFITANGATVNYIAKWNGTSWSDVGDGVSGDTGWICNTNVFSMAVFDDGSGDALYVGGHFTHAGGQPANHIAKWDGTSWSSLGSGLETFDCASVQSMAVLDDGDGEALYVGGRFESAGGLIANNIAKWNGTSWSTLGSGTNHNVMALEVFNDGTADALYASGWFTTAGSVTVNHIAKWDGSSWFALGDGLNSNAFAVEVFNDGSGNALYVGGWFNNAGGSTVNGIAKWDGSAWSDLDGGVSGNYDEVYSLARFDYGDHESLFVGGEFETVGTTMPISVSNIAEWVGCSLPETDGWPMFHHDPARTGFTLSTGPDTSSILWSYPLDGGYASDDTDSGPVVANGYVYVNGEDYLYCLDTETGEVEWSEQIFGVRDASPAVANGKVYVSGDKLYCLDALTGERIWDSSDLLPLNQIGTSSPIVIDDRVYVSGHEVYCLDAEGDPAQGTTILYWSSSINLYYWSTPTIADGKIYVFSKPDLYCLDLTDGNLLWQNSTVDDGWSHYMPQIPIVAEGYVFVGGIDQWNDFYCYVFDAEDGALKYRKHLPGEGGSKAIPAVANGKIYMAGDNDLYCLNVEDGTDIWSYSLPTESTSSSPAVTADGKLYMGVGTGQSQHHEKGKIICLDTETGQEIWRKTTTTEIGVMSSPAVADGKLYIKFDGSIHCFGDGWPMFHHDPSHSGFSTSTAPNTNNTIWEQTISNWVISSPAIVDNKIYIGDGGISCRDAATGALIWTNTDFPVGDSSPAVADNKIYIGSVDGNLYCLHVSNGTEIWDFKAGRNVWSSPTVVGDRVYIGSWAGVGEKNVFCLDADTGAEIWNFTMERGTKASSPAVVDGYVYIGSYAKKLYCLDASDGTEKWNYSTDALVFSTPAVADGNVYVGAGEYLYCIDAELGTLNWDFKGCGAGVIMSSPAIAYGYVYIGTGSGMVYCFNATTGGQEWVYTASRGIIICSPAVADDKVYIGTMGSGREVYCLNAYMGTEIWNYTTGGGVQSSPAIAYDKLFVASANGKLLAFEDLV